MVEGCGESPRWSTKGLKDRVRGIRRGETTDGPGGSKKESLGGEMEKTGGLILEGTSEVEASQVTLASKRQDLGRKGLLEEGQRVKRHKVD